MRKTTNPGDVVIMTDEKKEAPRKENANKDKFQDEFKGLPLEEKIKLLLKMEAVTLQEAFNYGLKESMKAADRLGDVLTEFSGRIEAEFKKATCSSQNAPPKAEQASKAN